jgi:DNA-binding NarL/FixJ family response regulator
VEGAVSFLVKDAAPEAVVAAVHDAAAGRSSFSPTALARLVALATRDAATDQAPSSREAASSGGRPTAPDLPDLVTAREWDVGRLVARGLTNGEIADALFVSPTTVKTHLSSLFAKLHVTNRVQLAIRVLEHDAVGA